MTADLARYVLPSRFIERYRPVKSHRHEKALGGYLFDPNAARFFVRLATSDSVPSEAIWTVRPLPDQSCGFCVLSGFHDESPLGYVICQTTFPAAEKHQFPLVRELTYRVRVRMAVLQELSNHVREAGTLLTGSEITAFLQRRIEELRS